MSRSSGFTASLLASFLWLSLTSSGQQPASAVLPGLATAAGELVIEPPTLINLGFEWFIQGDANRNAAVAVSFRKPGETAWRDGAAAAAAAAANASTPSRAWT